MLLVEVKPFIGSLIRPCWFAVLTSSSGCIDSTSILLLLRSPTTNEVRQSWNLNPILTVIVRETVSRLEVSVAGCYK